MINKVTYNHTLFILSKQKAWKKHCYVLNNSFDTSKLKNVKKQIKLQRNKNIYLSQRFIVL